MSSYETGDEDDFCLDKCISEVSGHVEELVEKVNGLDIRSDRAMLELAKKDILEITEKVQNLLGKLQDANVCGLSDGLDVFAEQIKDGRQRAVDGMMELAFHDCPSLKKYTVSS
jgi:hypothetical protein